MHDRYGSPKAREWWNKRGWRVKCNIGCRDENDFRKHVDKIHPIGGAKNGNQARIIKFTTHSLRRMFFYSISETKKLIMEKTEKIQNTSPRCGWTLSLSRNRIDLLRKANEAIEGNENFKFTYADMHGNLKFALNNL